MSYVEAERVLLLARAYAADIERWEQHVQWRKSNHWWSVLRDLPPVAAYDFSEQRDTAALLSTAIYEATHAAVLITRPASQSQALAYLDQAVQKLHNLCVDEFAGRFTS